MTRKEANHAVLLGYYVKKAEHGAQVRGDNGMRKQASGVGALNIVADTAAEIRMHKCASDRASLAFLADTGNEEAIMDRILDTPVNL